VNRSLGFLFLFYLAVMALIGYAASVALGHVFEQVAKGLA
jgi:hypothetical protein